MILLLVGPSGVGKTTLGKYASDNIPATEFYDLDDLVAINNGERTASNLVSKKGFTKFFELSEIEIQKIEKIDDARIHIIAVGAGTLVDERSIFLNKKHITITIIANPEVVLPRNPLGPGRPLDSFISVEYNEHRRKIYSQSQYILDVSDLSKEGAQVSFVNLIRKQILNLDK